MNSLKEIDTNTFVNVRLLCHHGSQLLAQAAISCLDHQADDSHTNMNWNYTALALETHPMPTAPQPLTLALNLRPFAWALSGVGLQVQLPCQGQTLESARVWLNKQLRASGLNPVQDRVHYQIPAHPRSDGRFELAGTETAVDQLAGWFTLGKRCLSQTPHGASSDVRVWPHHFDLGLVHDLGDGRSLGLGLSPGDQYDPLPYFYVSPWPYPEVRALPPLDVGRWHTQGFVAAVLQARDIWSAPDQAQLVNSFVDEAFTTAKYLI